MHVTRVRIRSIATFAVAACLVCLVGVAGISAAAQRHSTTPKADVKLARAELLPVATYPSGWKPQGKSSTSPQDSFWGGTTGAERKSLIQCLGISGKNIDPKPAEADGEAYANNNTGLGVTDTVDVYPNKAEAAEDVAAGANPKTPGCLDSLEGAGITQGILQSFGKGSTSNAPISITALPIPRYGDSDVFDQISLSVTSQGITGTFYIDDVSVQKGRSESNLEFTNQGIAPSISVIDRLAQETARAMGSS